MVLTNPNRITPMDADPATSETAEKMKIVKTAWDAAPAARQE
ncbi:MAG: hypothetical protein ACQEVT_06360 [Pseudomonadota bacterium]|nr:hypothetical protein [Roseovarius sp. EGI FJ00037]MCZ0810819.1 hypothetical protein [Roseovarius sp. EGI FJ00037]